MVVVSASTLSRPKPRSSRKTATSRTNHLSDRPGNVVSGTAAAASEDGSEDEGVTVHVDSPLVANGSSRSSPVKQESE